MEGDNKMHLFTSLVFEVKLLLLTVSPFYSIMPGCSAAEANIDLIKTISSCYFTHKEFRTREEQ